MFKKPFKIKSQIQLKSSEKKKFGNELRQYFPSLRDEDISYFTNNKDNIMRTKIITFKDEEVEVYVIDKVPMFFDVVDTNIKLPTVFMVWKFPHIMPLLTTNKFVFEKLKNGADFFIPGVITEGLVYDKNEFKKNDPVGINLIDNKAAVAVGISLIDKDRIFTNDDSEQKGKLARIFHTVGDQLFKFHPKPVLQLFGPPDWINPIEKEEISPTTEFPKEPETEVEKVETSEPAAEEEEEKELVKDAVFPLNDQEVEKEKMSELLEYCFLKALKNAPKTVYPILPANFYANHVLNGLPDGENLNIKKTKWKKFSTFLQEKSTEGLIKLQTVQKNEYSIAGVESNHRRIREFADPRDTKPITVEPKLGVDGKPVVQQIFSVSAATLPFFSKFGLKKADEMTRNDVRTRLNDYVKQENLTHPEMADKVVLDPILSRIIKDKEIASRGDLLAGILDSMSVKHKVSNCANGDSIIHKGKMPNVEFEVMMRTGNKKVTLISNLESYGVNVNSFSKELQQKAAASTTITQTVPGKKGPQIQVQGNQIHIAVNILKEKHNINEKFMKGLDKAPKSKKK